jgi:ABC-type phosphate/phosphonate transport system substrate-binding protein
MENIIIPVVLNGQKCEIRLARKLFSNDPEDMTVFWLSSEGSETEHCYYSDLPGDLKVQVSQAVEDFDRNEVKKSL